MPNFPFIDLSVFVKSLLTVRQKVVGFDYCRRRIKVVSKTVSNEAIPDQISIPVTNNITIKQYNPIPINFTVYYFLPAFFILFLSSCSTTKKNTYFQGVPKDTTLSNLVTRDFETKIRKSDLLSVTVASLSPENTALYNAPQNTVGSLTGYLVDEQGTITFIKLGSIHVEGMSIRQLKELLEKELSPYLKEPVVAVGFLNRHVTMMGAISPQVLPIVNDHMTLLDALASSGDIGARGRSDNILVIREKGDSKEFKRLNLTDETIFYSPYFYLQPNDIVYVEPRKEKTNNVTRIISYVTAGLSFSIFIIDRVLK